MPPKTNQDDTIYVGKDYTANFTETDGEDFSTFNELTYSFADTALGTEHFNRTQSGGGITTAGSSNEIAQVTINGSNTSGLNAPDDYYQELVTEDSSGNEQVAATGTIKLLPVQTDN